MAIPKEEPQYKDGAEQECGAYPRTIAETTRRPEPGKKVEQSAPELDANPRAVLVSEASPPSEINDAKAERSSDTPAPKSETEDGTSAKQNVGLWLRKEESIRTFTTREFLSQLKSNVEDESISDTSSHSLECAPLQNPESTPAVDRSKLTVHDDEGRSRQRALAFAARKFASAVKRNPEDHGALYNWAYLQEGAYTLCADSVSPSKNEFLVEPCKKFDEAKHTCPTLYDARNNWAISSSDWTKMRGHTKEVKELREQILVTGVDNGTVMPHVKMHKYGGVNCGIWILAAMLLSMLALAESGDGSGGRGRSGSPSGGLWLSTSIPSNVGLAIAVTTMAGIALVATVVYSHRSNLKSPWSRKRRKQVLLPEEWKSLFMPDGRLDDGGVKFLKKVRNGGVDPNIRAEVWPFLLGVYGLESSKDERDIIREQNRKTYESLRKQCSDSQKQSENSEHGETANSGLIEHDGTLSEVLDPCDFKEQASAQKPLRADAGSPSAEDSNKLETTLTTELLDNADHDKSGITSDIASDVMLSDSEHESYPLLPSGGAGAENFLENPETPSPLRAECKSKSHIDEDFATWQRIIRLDAVRANDEWKAYSKSQASISEIKAQQAASKVGLNDFEHLEACRIFHAARLVTILEAYALYDSEIGYCQGMSDLLSPLITVIEDDHEAFWCFVEFMKKARHNFRLDEIGIRRQLATVSKIIKCKDSHLYRHLEKLEAEDCFFVYRMVVVLFRRELTFEQTLSLWEVMWADQAAIRAGIVISGWRKMRLQAPPTDDLLLYAIAACVLQRRKTIIEKYSSMDEIMRECHSMAGRLDVWKLLDDAHDLVVNLHDKI